MTKPSRVVIEDGGLKAIYSDDLLPYIERIQAEFGLPEGHLSINRATRIEPDPERKAGGNWLVDLTPMGGPICYTDENDHPFVRRQDAIDFELRWLNANWLNQGGAQDARTVTEEE